MIQDRPFTRASLLTDFRACGVTAGRTVIVHCSMRQIGYVIGGAEALARALLDAVGETGTVVVPAQSWRNLDPITGVHTLPSGGPLPETWWGMVRDHHPAFDPAWTPSVGMGALAELIRTHPRAERSPHPARSFAAVGKEAAEICKTQPLESPMGEGSPLAKLYDLGASVLLLGVGHERNTSLHLAEARTDYDGKRTLTESSAVFTNGERRWVSYEVVEPVSDDFGRLGAAFDAANGVQIGRVGRAEARLLPVRGLVDFAVDWMQEHR